LTSKTIDHVYANPGKYDLQLVISYKEEQVKRINNKINIDEPIEVISNAYQEQ